jgi:hypothetical protein
VAFALRTLLLARVGEKLFHTDDLAVQRAGDQRFALDLAPFGVSNRDVIDFQRFANGALVIGTGLNQIR